MCFLDNMKSIALFNNKGGVGKTTLLCNLASYFQTKLHKKVLVIDADPQCSATIYIYANENLSKFYEKGDTPSIYKVIQHLKKARGGYIPLRDIPIQKENRFGLDVLIGDTKLALAEDFLSKDWADATNGEERGLLTTFVFKGLLNEIESHYDYVFFDMGPSLGAINRTVLFACDYFLVPMSSDIFCLRAIDNISTSLKNWKKMIEGGLHKYEEEEGCAFNASGVKLQFLGYVTQQYNARTQFGEKRPVKAYDRIIEKFSKEITTKFSNFYPQAFSKEDLKLGDLPNWNSLVAFSQIANKPIFDLTSADGVFGAHVQKVKDFEDIMRIVSDRIISNISKNELAE